MEGGRVEEPARSSGEGRRVAKGARAAKGGQGGEGGGKLRLQRRRVTEECGDGREVTQLE